MGGIPEQQGLASIPVAPLAVRACSYRPGPNLLVMVDGGDGIGDGPWRVSVDRDDGTTNIAPIMWVGDHGEPPEGRIALVARRNEDRPPRPDGLPWYIDLDPEQAMALVGGRYVPAESWSLSVGLGLLPGETEPTRGLGDEPEWVGVVVVDGRMRHVEVGDLGDLVVFGDATDKVNPLHIEWRGQSLAAAALGLDTTHPGDVEQFFTRFGAPPEGPFLTLRELRFRLGFVAYRARQETPVGDTNRFGSLGVDDAGVPTIFGDIWQLTELSVALERRGGRVGYCEAPAPWGSGPCGKPFVASRLGRRRYCSDMCQSRATSRRAYARRTGKER